MKYSVSELSDLIRDRRTIQPKDFSLREVHRDIIERVVQNAIWAPNHGMTQPWRFVVFTGDARSELATFLGNEYTRTTSPEKFMQRKHDNLVQRPQQSSVVIALGLEHDPKGKIDPEEERLAMACAVQNMYLTCTAYGLGAFWATSSVLTSDAMRAYLGLPEGAECLGLFYMGYPSVEWPKGYRKPWTDLVRWA